jgi:hypothetical protein
MCSGLPLIIQWRPRPTVGWPQRWATRITNGTQLLNHRPQDVRRAAIITAIATARPGQADTGYGRRHDGGGRRFSVDDDDISTPPVANLLPKEGTSCAHEEKKYGISNHFLRQELCPAGQRFPI